MKNLACVFAGRLTEYARLPVREGRTAVEIVMNFAKNLPDVSRILVLAEEGSAELPRVDIERRTLGRSSWDPVSLIETMKAESMGFDNIVYFWADTPLLDIELTRRMYASHLEGYAEYCFADGYPGGLAPEFLKTSALPAISLLAGKVSGAVERDCLFSVIQKDINAFDLETEISPKDLRLYRVSLSCDTKRNFILTKSLIEAGAGDEASATELIERERRLLRTLPAYASVQIVESCPQACALCPYPVFAGDPRKKSGEMPLGSFSRIADGIASFCDDATIGVSLWGEPSGHSRMADIAKAVLSRKGLSLLIETSGIGWKGECLEALLGLDPSRVTWIVSLDAIDGETYGRLRGEGFDEAKRFAESLVSRSRPNAYVQAVRVRDNEEGLENFYRYWKERTENLIIQKYDPCAGLLPDRKVADLSPIVRNACWHLMRDVTVLMDGTVTMCREDVRGEYALGNIFEAPLEDIWEKGEDRYLSHVAGRYDPICMRCDEYYTYNY